MTSWPDCSKNRNLGFHILYQHALLALGCKLKFGLRCARRARIERPSFWQVFQSSPDTVGSSTATPTELRRCNPGELGLSLAGIATSPAATGWPYRLFHISMRWIALRMYLPPPARKRSARCGTNTGVPTCGTSFPTLLVAAYPKGIGRSYRGAHISGKSMSSILRPRRNRMRSSSPLSTLETTGHTSICSSTTARTSHARSSTSIIPGPRAGVSARTWESLLPSNWPSRWPNTANITSGWI